ncbi:MAG: hypothetical protein JRD03_10700 [Deltaproteobacteria bacterium]|nr:hypothetical protein [Deltaproteobacteria bacterium]
MPHRVVPGHNLAVLRNTSTDGRGSTQIKKVGVVIKTNQRTRGACHPKKSTDTFSLRLRMVDDDGDVIFDETRSDLKCDRRIGQEKFMVEYDVENCEDSEAPSKTSKGNVRVTATTEDGTIVEDRTLKCNK